MSSTDVKKKSFWTKPEGITGLLFLGGLGIGLYKLLPYLITFAENTIYLGCMVGGVGLLSYLIIDNKSLLWYMYKTAMFKITNFFVRIDPIAVAKVYINNLKGKKEDINEQIQKLNGSLQRTVDDIKKNEDDINDNKLKAEEAQKLNMESAMMLASKEAVRIQDWNKELYPLAESMKKMLTFLKKMYEVADYIIKDKESEITIMEKKYKSIKIAVMAMRSAQDIMGQNDKEAMFEQAMDFIKDDMANKLGEMDRILEMATPFTNELDLRNAMDNRKAMDMLNNFNAKEFEQGILSLSTKNPIPVLITNPSATPQENNAGTGQYGSYFK